MLQKLLQAFERIVMRPYWRLIRGQTLGVQGIVIRSGTEVLLVRQSYKRCIKRTLGLGGVMLVRCRRISATATFTTRRDIIPDVFWRKL
jgi:hypothetical protein